MHLSSTRNAFTLVELLVVIAIIGVLIAMLLPAVQAAREAARRMQCSNNLKQLALGSLQIEAAHGCLPSGGWGWVWIGDPERGFGKDQPGGWAYTILPYIEQQDVFDLGKGADTDRVAIMQGRLQIPITTFICPSRRQAEAYFDPPRSGFSTLSDGFDKWRRRVVRCRSKCQDGLRRLTRDE